MRASDPINLRHFARKAAFARTAQDPNPIDREQEHERRGNALPGLLHAKAAGIMQGRAPRTDMHGDAAMVKVLTAQGYRSFEQCLQPCELALR